MSDLLEHKQDNWGRFKTDPRLEDSQLEQLVAELDRITAVYENVLKQSPLDFSLNLKKEASIENTLKLRKRECIGLMKELVD